MVPTGLLRSAKQNAPGAGSKSRSPEGHYGGVKKVRRRSANADPRTSREPATERCAKMHGRPRKQRSAKGDSCVRKWAKRRYIRRRLPETSARGPLPARTGKTAQANKAATGGMNLLFSTVSAASRRGCAGRPPARRSHRRPVGHTPPSGNAHRTGCAPRARRSSWHRFRARPGAGW